MRKFYTVILNEHKIEPHGNWSMSFAFYQGDLLFHFFHGHYITDDRFKETPTRKKSVYIGAIWLEDKDFPIKYPIKLISGTILNSNSVFQEKKKKAFKKKRRKKVYLPGQLKPKRILVFERDNYTCVSCGETCKPFLTIDHKIPRSKGGSNKIHNLQTMCRKCNHAKGDSIVSNNTLGKWIQLIKR